MINSGQICLAAKRAYVPESMYDAICEALAKLASETVIGNGMDPKTQYGPVQTRPNTRRSKPTSRVPARKAALSLAVRSRMDRVLHPADHRARHPG